MALFDTRIDNPETIIAIRRAILDGHFKESGGLVTVNWSSEGSSVSKQWAISARELLNETKAFLQAYDPELYGRRVKKVLPYYTGY